MGMILRSDRLSILAQRQYWALIRCLLTYKNKINVIDFLKHYNKKYSP